MHRRSLIKCILGLAAAPKILAEMGLSPHIPTRVKGSGILLSDFKSCNPSPIEYDLLVSEIAAVKPINNESFTYEGVVKKLQQIDYGNETKNT